MFVKDYHNKSVGSIGENIALSMYQRQGYHIITHNFRTPIGEIDIIAQHENSFVFIEVKTRIGCTKGKPYEQVQPYKFIRLKQAIHYYCKTNNISIEKNRLAIHVCSVILNQDLTLNKINQYPLTFSDIR